MKTRYRPCPICGVPDGVEWVQVASEYDRIVRWARLADVCGDCNDVLELRP